MVRQARAVRPAHAGRSGAVRVVRLTWLVRRAIRRQTGAMTRVGARIRRAVQGLARRMGHGRRFARVGRLLVPADRLVGRLTGGRVVALGIVPSLLLTTTGRRSGRPRSNPLLYVPDGDAFVVIGSNWGQAHHPAWALNLRAEPAAMVRVGGARHPVRARLATGAERDRLWRLLVAAWPAYETYARRADGRDIPIFRLEPAARPPDQGCTRAPGRPAAGGSAEAGGDPDEAADQVRRGGRGPAQQ